MEGNAIRTFKNDEFGEVRTMVIDGEPWFVGKDVASVLGYSDTFGALKKHVDDDDKQNCQNGSFESNRGLIVINESGLYSLILSSKLPAAKHFKHWVTSEILPSIRKNGGYISDSELMVSRFFGNLPSDQQIIVRGLFDNIVAQQNRITSLEATNKALVSETLSWVDRNLINALVRRYAATACNGEFGLAWVEFKKELLYKYSINVNSRLTAYTNRTGKKTKPKTLDMINDEEIVSAFKTIVSMCENKAVDISDLINKHKEVSISA